MNNKLCSTCKKETSLSYTAYCRSCNNARQRAYCKKTGNKYRKATGRRRREWLNSVKDVPCQDCGVKYPPYIMEFDHIKEKSFGLAKATALHSIEAIQREMDKCEIVCSNCHRERTHKRRSVK